MAKYQFGQARRSTFNNFVSDLSIDDDEVKYLITESILIPETVFFKDSKITLSGDNILQPTNESGSSIKSYYIKIKFYKQSESDQTITIKLVSSNKQEDNEQIVETINISKGPEDEYVIYETVLKPNQDYNEIQFILARKIEEDYLVPSGSIDGYPIYGREMDIEIEKLQEINNLITALNVSSTGKLKQIGVQSAPGFLMSIDGEPVRVGRTGMYEINYGVSISYLGFIINDDKTQFLLDYQY